VGRNADNRNLDAFTFPFDDSAPSLERQLELNAAYQDNVRLGRAPYDAVQIRTRGELTWIMNERGWYGTSKEVRERNRRAVIDLSFADMRRINLRGSSFFLSNFTGSLLDFADLSDCNFYGGNFSGAYLNGTDFTESNLQIVNLSGANFLDTCLAGADLDEARLNGQTRLRGPKVDKHTRFGDIVLNDALVTLIDWSKIDTLGDEDYIRLAKTRNDKILALHKAIRAYRAFASALSSQGFKPEASRFRLRGQKLERKLFLMQHHIMRWLFAAILNAMSGTGERPVRALATYCLTLATFAIIYYEVTHALLSGISSLTWSEALVLSITSFHGRGFFPGNILLGDWVARIAALEAMIGLFIEIVFIATFSRRFLSD
jgi:hypothetical protein